ncbi:DUF4340 domain-containing protein [Sabulicella rubraurantiaca]|uniref:DUF4340 domain-containing protein n=1 Tax=Sabulicella rubraurantiaca TaxID=2811429 RepID=UPI001A96D47C|nr:DUF4340 domain-containing protein [Sabulicella rubraurantiaca]
MIGRRGLAGLGAAAAATLGAGIFLAPREEAAPTSGALAFPGLAERLGRAARVEIRRHDGGVTLSRDGETWRIAERAGWPARPAKVHETLTALTELRLLEPRDASASFGTDDPMRPGATGALLRVLDASGAPLISVILGTRRSRAQPGVTDSIHIRRPEEAQGWLAEGRLTAEADPALWLLRDLVDLPAQRLRRVEVRRAGDEPLVLERPGEVDAPLVIVEPRDPPRPDAVALDEAGRVFEGLTLIEVRRDDDAPGEALGEARFTFTDNLAIQAWGRRQESEFWVTLRAEGDAEAARLNALWNGYAFQLGQWKERAMLPRLEDLLEQG